MERTETAPPADTTRERTALAWNRSGLAIVACIAVLLRHLWPLRGVDGTIGLALLSLAAVVWVVALGLLWSRRRGAEPKALGPRGALMLSIGTLLLALIGFGLSFFPPS